ncbi:Spc97 / Spc98 family protein [Cryptosporidium muris RN66]|uniref:Spc97 / Spc98 family protein n=1 Tax=Cryptosporidium muris (strain RN66) TaxID=441375 RepID=B6ACQ8_CRYMR|nr:Spc97 / Spc98 family protein [Cryptosporidium muris RN66]EEA05912.1 Spc97 / Spc98 family protein [Cryptosporidium muris RN66]|eukprot:XP_002140261.1 Spc97 / Spc98 family protein [Cryptosporidium muris RN66]
MNLFTWEGNSLSEIRQKPTIIPELLKELVKHLVATHETLENCEKHISKEKLVQRCYLKALKVIKAHIVSGSKSITISDSPLDEALELLISSNKSIQAQKLSLLYDRLSILTLAIPELSKFVSDGPSGRFEDKVIRLLLPLWNTKNSNISNISIRNKSVFDKFNDGNLRVLDSSDTICKSIGQLRPRTSVSTLVEIPVAQSSSTSSAIFTIPLFVLEQCLLSPSQEVALVHDILYALQGYDSQFIHYDTSSDQFRIMPSVYAPETIRTMVSEICYLGVLYRRMNLVIDEASNIKTKNSGSVCKAFLESVKQVISDYNEFIVAMQSQVQETVSYLARLQSRQNPNLELLNGNKQIITLRKLYHRVLEQIYRLEKPFALFQALMNTSSSSILSGLYLGIHTGHEYHRGVMMNIFNRCLLSWLENLNSFLITGVLNENQAQDLFIIQYKEAVGIRFEYVPTFMQYESARLIGYVGFTRSLIQKVNKAYNKKGLQHGEHSLVNNDNLKSTENLSGFKITSEMVLNSWSLYSHLSGLSKQCDNELLDLLFNKGNIKNHLEVLKLYMLGIHGDFWDIVISGSTSELDKPAKNVVIQALITVLDEAKLFHDKIKNKNAFNMKSLNRRCSKNQIINSYLDRLRLLCYEPTLGDTGWDIYGLDYVIDDDPISFLLCDNTLSRYRRIFRNVWKIFTCITKLTQTWFIASKFIRNKNLNTNNSSTNLDDYFLDILNKGINLARCILLSVTEIRNNLLFDSIDSLWNCLQSKLNECASFEKVQKVHQEFLDGIEGNLFILDDGGNNKLNLKTNIQEISFSIDRLLRLGCDVSRLINIILANFSINQHKQNIHEQLDQYGKTFRECVKGILLNIRLLQGKTIRSISLTYDTLSGPINLQDSILLNLESTLKFSRFAK